MKPRRPISPPCALYHARIRQTPAAAKHTPKNAVTGFNHFHSGSNIKSSSRMAIANSVSKSIGRANR